MFPLMDFLGNLFKCSAFYWVTVFPNYVDGLMFPSCKVGGGIGERPDLEWCLK